MAELTPKEMQQKMELQLHEQYAINNNANFNSIIVLIAALIAVLGTFFNAYSKIDDNEKLNLTNPILILYFGVSVVLFIIYFVSLLQGVKQRCEQFVVFAIRSKYYPDLLNEVAPNSGRDRRTFPKGYHPFGKKGFSIVQGLYGYTCVGCLLIFSLISIMIIKFHHHSCCCFMLILIIFLLSSYATYKWQQCKYIKYEEMYKRYNPMPLK